MTYLPVLSSVYSNFNREPLPFRGDVLSICRTLFQVLDYCESQEDETAREVLELLREGMK